MIINDEREQEKVPMSSICAGRTFLYQGKHYLKTVAFNGNKLQAVNLETGGIKGNFKPESEVVETLLTVEVEYL